MNGNRLNELLAQCQSPIERDLVKKLYPCLTTDCAQELCAQYKIICPNGLKTILDFAFPEMKIAIYCDGFEWHGCKRDIFKKDRLQLRELQLDGWVVLRFAGSEIHFNSEMVVKTIERTIARREKQTNRLAQLLRSIRIWRYVTTVLGVGLLIAIVLLWLGYSKVPDVRMIGEVALIPAGEFRMGGSDSDAEIDEHPVHTIHVDGFYIDKYEVTNAQYKKFVDANPQWQKNSIQRVFHNGRYLDLWQDNTYPPGKENHPVVYVSWYAAMAYAQWAEKRLPTEAEWEKAARGRLIGAKYPWGDEIDSTMANYGGELGDTKPVGFYPPNDYGLYDMAGNVMEWCLDAYDKGFYFRSPLRNPIAGGNLVNIIANFQKVTGFRAVRSGCWYNVPMHVRVADRYGASPDHVSKGRGFRCVRNIR